MLSRVGDADVPTAKDKVENISKAQMANRRRLCSSANRTFLRRKIMYTIMMEPMRERDADVLAVHIIDIICFVVSLKSFIIAVFECLMFTFCITNLSIIQF